MKTKQIKVMALLLATGGLLLPSCKGNSEQQQQGMQAPELAVLTVSESDESLETGFPATLEGTNDVEIRPQISGFLTKVYVQPGQKVSKGQTLFTIDQVQLKAAVDQARASVAVAQANVNTATTNANNNKILLDKNIISASAYQTSVDALNAAKAQLQQAQAALTSAQKNLSYSNVTAPVSGVVGDVDFKEGTLVSPSTLLTILSNNSVMDALFSLNEKEVLALTENGARSLNSAIASLPEVSLKLANGDIYPKKGKIISASGVIDAATGSVQMKAAFPNPDGMLHSGNTGLVLIPSVHPNTIKVPQSATFEIQDMKFCYVLGDSAKIHSTPITVAPENDGQSYIVTSGLKPGDVIVVEGVGVIAKDGMVITPKSGVTPKADAQQAAQQPASK
ncbi:MAG: efflux RND transporter periplasmic adaptor subunit [Muribaculaceae bacterium]|nr:efflux RND transporter periplasmic adaptor subunit [Muribaculaceae bacterium]